MKIAIKNPAPKGKYLERWGDFHFGNSLASALRMHGAEVVQHFWPDWGLSEDEDAVLWLRGRRFCTPRPGVPNLMWIMSHPASVNVGELQGFDLVYAASKHLANELSTALGGRVELMRQCTDPGQFNPGQSPLPGPARQGLLFVANSRNVRRPILDWTLAAGLRPTVVGQGWEHSDLRPLVAAPHIANHELPRLYRSARYGLNDHWGDMGHYQIINNRVFDAMACGLPLISDGFPELEEVAGNAVAVARDPGSLLDAYWRLELDYDAAVEACLERWAVLEKEYTFDARARKILEDLEHLPPKERNSPAAVPRAPSWAEALLRRHRKVGPTPHKNLCSLLHVCPSGAHSAGLARMPSVSAISAGFGEGPWNVRLDGLAGELSARHYDIVYLDDAEQWTRWGTEELLQHLVSYTGAGALVSSSTPSLLDPLLSAPEFAVVCRDPLVLRRTLVGPVLHAEEEQPHPVNNPEQP